MSVASIDPRRISARRIAWALTAVLIAVGGVWDIGRELHRAAAPGPHPNPRIRIRASAISVNLYRQPLRLGAASAFFSINEGTLATADALLRDEWPERGVGFIKLAWPLNWQENPRNDAYFRFQFYSLQPTASLLWAWQSTGDSRYKTKLVAILRSYLRFERTRHYDGYRFDNNHATAFRAMVLVNTLAKLHARRAITPSVEAELRIDILRLGRFLASPQHFEPGQSHAFSEATALAIVATDVAGGDAAREWRRTANDRLLRTLTDTIDANGVEVENSPFYDIYVLGIVAQIATWSREHDQPVYRRYAAAVKRMLPYAADVTNPGGTLPMLGATALTYVSRQDPHVYGALARLSERFRWAYTLGMHGVPPPRMAIYPISGLAILRSPLKNLEDTIHQTFVTFEAGRYRTRHSHLDALNVTMNYDGRAVLPEAGLYTYIHGGWFSYFHGTRGHNTVLVDGADQSPGQSHITDSGILPEGAWVAGRTSLARDARHDRLVVLVKRKVAFVVDRLTSRRSRQYTQIWHFGAGASSVITRQGVLELDMSGNPVLLVASAPRAGQKILTVSGAMHPIQGWISGAYGFRTPAPTVEISGRGRSGSFATALLGDTVAGRSVAVWETEHRTHVTVHACLGTEAYVVAVHWSARGGFSRARVTAGRC